MHNFIVLWTVLALIGVIGSFVGGINSNVNEQSRRTQITWWVVFVALLNAFVGGLTYLN